MAPEGGRLLIIQSHSGGSSVNGLKSEIITCRNLALETEAVVLNVEHGLAAEVKFPIPVNRPWDSVKWGSIRIPLVSYSI
jgi:hypothetical protein